MVSVGWGGDVAKPHLGPELLRRKSHTYRAKMFRRVACKKWQFSRTFPLKIRHHLTSKRNVIHTFSPFI